MFFRNILILVIALACETTGLVQAQQASGDADIEVRMIAFQRPLPKDFPEHSGAFDSRGQIKSKPSYRWTFLVKAPNLSKIKPSKFGKWLQISGTSESDTIQLKPLGTLGRFLGPQKSGSFALSSRMAGKYGLVDLEVGEEEFNQIAGKTLTANITLSVADDVEVVTSELIDLETAGQNITLGDYKIHLLGKVKDQGISLIPFKAAFEPEKIDGSGSGLKQPASQPSGSSSKPQFQSLSSPKQTSGFRPLQSVQGSSSSLKPVSSTGKLENIGFEIEGSSASLASFDVLVNNKPLSWRSSTSDNGFSKRSYRQGPNSKGVIELRTYKNLRKVKKTLSVAVPAK